MTQFQENTATITPDASIVVTGASGFIGAKLAHRLATLGARVHGLSRSPGALAPHINSDTCNHVACDILDADALRRAIQRLTPTVVFHVASAPDGAETPDLALARLRVNCLGTLNLLQACAALDAPPIVVYGDTRKVYGGTTPPHREDSPLAPTSSYAASKAAGWLQCQVFTALHNVPCVSLRPSLIYGPGQGRNLVQVAIEAAVGAAPTLRLMGGAQTRDPLYIDDALEAFLLAADRARKLAGRVVNIGGGEEVCVREIAERVISIVGASTRVVCEQTKARPSEIWRSACDNEQAGALLGWSPKHSLRDGLARTVQAALAGRDAMARAGAAS